MPHDNEAPEVIQGEARARLQAMADDGSMEAVYGAFPHPNATMIADVRNLLAFASPAEPAPGAGGGDEAVVDVATRLLLAEINPASAEQVRRGIRKIEESTIDGGAVMRAICNALAYAPTPSLPAGREAIAREIDPGAFSGEGDYTWVKRNVRRLAALAKADAILAIGPSVAGPGVEATLLNARQFIQEGADQWLAESKVDGSGECKIRHARHLEMLRLIDAALPTQGPAS